MDHRTPDQRRAMEARAACEGTPRRKDGVQAWLGLTIIVLSAVITACLLAYAAWHWAGH